jgi:DNA-directed RNA polymerase specialized sigma subunit
MDFLEKEFAEPFKTWQSSTNKRQANSAMLTAVDPVIQSAVKTYGRGEQSVLLHSRARQLALEALDSYDPSKAKLRTHLMSHLQGLRRISTKMEQGISVPEKIQIDQLHVRESEQTLKDKLGRDPSDAELADSTGLSLKRLAYIRGASIGLPESFVEQIGGQDDEENLYQPAVEARDDNSGWYEFVYYGLQPTDQLILEHSTGMHGKKVLSNQALAAKLKLTPSAVSQRKLNIQRQLNQRKELGVF